jgi:hypothetical protein
MNSVARKPLPFPNRTLHRIPGKPLRVPSLVHRLVPREPADQKLVERVRREFSDMRGLSPTMGQAQRLFHVGCNECIQIFRQLLREGFLVLCADDRYRLNSRHVSSGLRRSTYADFAK